MALPPDLSEIWEVSKNEANAGDLPIKIFDSGENSGNDFPGIITPELQLCPLPRPCPLNEKCGYVHSTEELAQRKRMKQSGNSHHLERMSSEVNRLRQEENLSNDLLHEIVGNVSVHCDQNLYIMHLDKCTQFRWEFTIKPTKHANLYLKHVFLLNHHFPEFTLESVAVGNILYQSLPQSCQHWKCNSTPKICLEAKETAVVVCFYSRHFGNFDQKVIFQFDNNQKVVRNVGVQVAHESTLMKTLLYQPLTKIENELTWIQRHKVIPFDGEPEINYDGYKYRLPPNIDNLVEFGAFDHLDKSLKRDNYIERLHTLLYIEEYQRRKNLERLSFTVEDLQIFLDNPVPGVNRNRTARVPFDDYLIAQAYVIFGKSGKALIRIGNPESLETNLYVVYEVIVERFLGNEIIFELSSDLDNFLTQKARSVSVEVCFRFVDTFQYMHKAVDTINLNIVFPESHHISPLSWPAHKQDSLSKEQSIAFQQMINPTLSVPILLLGPFGSGKTRTIASAILNILKQAATESVVQGENSRSRILICTHSNSAADHYIEDFIHPFLRTFDTDVSWEPLRINWEFRYQASVSDVVLHYCLFEDGRFPPPDLDAIKQRRIIVCTLVTADILCKLNLPDGFFSHIFIDEAAQAMEVEAIIPLTMANSKTKLVLAGDHLQLGPPLSSATSKSLGLGTSILERLFQLYPSDSPYKLKLLENFRSFVDIVEISSVLFYEGTLQCNNTRPNSIEYPIQFHGIHGSEELGKSHPSYWNQAEATEVLHRLRGIETNWPDVLEKLVWSRICVLAFYSAQIQEIRLLLRKNGLSSVRVDNVNNVQGLEFDAVIISTVRSYNETAIYEASEGKDLGFLSNPKLLNTAITRAKYLCIFIGEPVGLCSIGDCKPCWKAILTACHTQGTFHYRLPFSRVMAMIDDHQQISKIEENRLTLSDQSIRNNKLSVEKKPDDSNSPLTKKASVSQMKSSDQLNNKVVENAGYSQRSFSESSQENSKFVRSQTVSQVGICKPIQKNVHASFTEHTRSDVKQTTFQASISDDHRHKHTPTGAELRLSDIIIPEQSVTENIERCSITQQDRNTQFAAFNTNSLVPISGPPFQVSPISARSVAIVDPWYQKMRMLPIMQTQVSMPRLNFQQPTFASEGNYSNLLNQHPMSCDSFYNQNPICPRPQFTDQYAWSLYGCIPQASRPGHSHSHRYVRPFIRPQLSYMSYAERPPQIDVYGGIIGSSSPPKSHGFPYPYMPNNSTSKSDSSNNSLSSMILKAGARVRFLCSFFYFSLESMSHAYLDYPNLQVDVEQVRYEYDSLVKNYSQSDHISRAMYIQHKLKNLSVRCEGFTQQIGSYLTTFLSSHYHGDGNDSSNQTVLFESLSRMLIDLKLDIEYKLFKIQDSTTTYDLAEDILSSQNLVVIKIHQIQDYVIILDQQLRNCHSSLAAQNHSFHLLLVRPKLEFIGKEIENCVEEISIICGQEDNQHDYEANMPATDNVNSSMSESHADSEPGLVDGNLTIREERQSYGTTEPLLDDHHSFSRDLSNIIALTEEDTLDGFELEKEELFDRIQKMRLSDKDIDQWFIDRHNDPFVQEYITTFDRRIAERLPSPNPAGDSTVGRSLSEYKISPSFSPYLGINEIRRELTGSLIEGIIYYETNRRIDMPHAVLVLPNQGKLHLYGLRDCNRALMGDKVLAQFKTYSQSESCGRVITVLERGRWSILCRTSPLDRKLMLPHDNKGPPILIIPFTDVKQVINSRSVGSADCNSNETFIVKIIGWPIEMKYPIGLIEKKLTLTDKVL